MSILNKLQYQQFFNLSNNYTLKELRKAKNNKIKNMKKLDISMIDKQIYAKNIYIIYKFLKSTLIVSNFNNHRNIFFKALDKFNKEHSYSNIIKKNY